MELYGSISVTDGQLMYCHNNFKKKNQSDEIGLKIYTLTFVSNELLLTHFIIIITDMGFRWCRP